MARAHRLDRRRRGGRHSRTLCPRLGLALGLILLPTSFGGASEGASTFAAVRAETGELEAKARALYKKAQASHSKEASTEELLELRASIRDAVEAGDPDACRADWWCCCALWANHRGKDVESELRFLEEAFSNSGHVSRGYSLWTRRTLGQRLYQTRRWDRAYEVLTPLAADEEYSEVAVACGYLADIDRIRRDFDRAHAHLDEMERTIERHKTPFEQKLSRLDLHDNRAQTFASQGLPILAYGAWKKSWDVLKSIAPEDVPKSDEKKALSSVAWRTVNAFLRRADIRLQLLEFDRLEEETVEAIDWMEAEENHARERLGEKRYERQRLSLELRLGIARARLEHWHPERPRLAGDSFRRVIESEASYDGDVVSAHLRLARLLLDEGRLAECAGALERARTRIDEESESAEESMLLNRAMLAGTEAELRAAESRAAESREDAGLEDPGPDDRQSALEGALRRAEGVFDELVEDWRSQPLSLSGVGTLRSGRARRLISGLIHASLALDPGAAGRERAFEFVSRAASAGTLARELGSPVPTLAEIREGLLPEDEGLLVYWIAPESWHLFAVDRYDIVHVPLPSRLVMEEARVDLLNLALRSPGPLGPAERERRRRDLEEAARTLHDLLLPEGVRPHSESWRGFAVVGADLMGYIPFECLLPESGEAFGLSKIVRYLPSVPIGMTLVERRARRLSQRPSQRASTGREGVAADGLSLGGVLVTSPNPGADADALESGLDPIGIDRATAADLVAEAEARRWEILLGGSATADALTDDLLGRAAIVQFLTHGVHDVMRDPSPRIVLSPDARGSSLVDSRRLASLALPSTVVLTVCGVGRGIQRWGDPGTTDLSGAAWRSPGVESVLLPYGRLEVRSARALTRALHARIAAGDTLGQALLGARRAVASLEGGRFDDPFYYSLLHLHGLGDASPLPSAMIEPRPSASVDLDTKWITGGIVAVVVGAAALAFVALARRQRKRRRSRAIAR